MGLAASTYPARPILPLLVCCSRCLMMIRFIVIICIGCLKTCLKSESMKITCLMMSGKNGIFCGQRQVTKLIIGFWLIGFWQYKMTLTYIYVGSDMIAGGRPILSNKCKIILGTML